MADKKGNIFIRRYSRREIMKQARWFLLLVGVINIGLGLFIWNGTNIGGAYQGAEMALGMSLIGAAYVVCGLVPWYWARLVAVVLFTLDSASKFLDPAAYKVNVSTIIFLALGAFLAYKMVKYRNAPEEEEAV